MVYVFEGEGKGKTSAALGVAVRMLAIGKKVVWISWFKTEKWPLSEMKLPDYFGEQLEMYWMGEGFYLRGLKTAKTQKATVYDFDTPTGHKIAAEQALKLVEKLLQRKGTPDLIVMDEVIQAIDERLLSEKEVLEVIKKRGKVHLVLTGHV